MATRMNHQRLPLFKDQEVSKHRHFNCCSLAPAQPWLCSCSELRAQGIWNESLARTQSFLPQPSNGHFAKSPISQKHMEFRRACPLDLTTAGLVQPILGSEPVLGGGEETGKEREDGKAPHCLLGSPGLRRLCLFPLGYLKIQSALWRRHFSHHHSFIPCHVHTVSHTVWDPDCAANDVSIHF